MKKTVSFALAIFLIISVVPFAYASTSTEQYGADVLYNLGLFQGTGTDELGMPNYNLDAVPTRAEAIAMLVRLLGKSEEVQSNFYTLPFDDIPSWAVPYVGYAYENGLTSGISATKFGSNSKISATQYLTFILRSLGYTTGEDFQWDSAWILTDELNITNGEYNELTTSPFTRGNMVTVSCEALSAKIKGTSTTLLDVLKKENAVPQNAKLSVKENNARIIMGKATSYDDEVDMLESIRFANMNGQIWLTFTMHPETKCYGVAPFPAGLGSTNSKYAEGTESYQAFEDAFGTWHKVHKFETGVNEFRIALPSDYFLNNNVDNSRMVFRLWAENNKTVVYYFDYTKTSLLN